MDVLLDTHFALWYLKGDARMPAQVIAVVSDMRNAIYVSDVSLWEIAIKHMKAPDKMPYSAGEFSELCAEVGFLNLPISREAILAYEALDISQAEGIHRDPFDRLLIAQSKAENMLLMTHDKSFSLYDEPLVRVF